MPLLQRHKGRKRSLVTVVAVLMLMWGGGFLYFLQMIPSTPEKPNVKTDAIIVLTGGTLRLEKGLDLLEGGLAKKLFVSGVHSGVEVKELLALSRSRPSTLDCCIILGYEAYDTFGNAIETANWMREKGFQSMRLVTAAYHMPRSIVELKAVLPDVEIISHPVYPSHVRIDEWYLWPGTAALLAGEYSKIIFIYFRQFVSNLIQP